MTVFFRMHRKHKKIIFSKSESRKQRSKKILKINTLVELELSKEVFLSREYPDFGSKF